MSKTKVVKNLKALGFQKGPSFLNQQEAKEKASLLKKEGKKVKVEKGMVFSKVGFIPGYQIYYKGQEVGDGF